MEKEKREEKGRINERIKGILGGRELQRKRRGEEKEAWEKEKEVGVKGKLEAGREEWNS